MSTELHLTWDDKTLESVLNALAAQAGTAGDDTSKRLLQARQDIEEAEQHTARTLNYRDSASQLTEEPAGDRTWVTRWFCEPPAMDARFQVMRDEWHDEWRSVAVRDIHRIKLAAAGD